MSRKPASVTEADVNRILRGAKRAGAIRATVKLTSGAEVVVDLRETVDSPPETVVVPLAPKRRISL